MKDRPIFVAHKTYLFIEQKLYFLLIKIFSWKSHFAASTIHTLKDCAPAGCVTCAHVGGAFLEVSDLTNSHAPMRNATDSRPECKEMQTVVNIITCVVDWLRRTRLVSHRGKLQISKWSNYLNSFITRKITCQHYGNVMVCMKVDWTNVNFLWNFWRDCGSRKYLVTENLILRSESKNWILRIILFNS